MACSGTLLFFTVAYLSALQIQAGYVSVDCTKENIGVIGQQSMLECVVIFIGKDGKYPEIKQIIWKKYGVELPVLKYENKKIKPSPRHSLADQSWNGNKMNVSLLITNTEITDEQNYNCTVMTSRGSGKSSTSLKLKAKYKKPTIDLSDEKMNPNDEKTLICRTDGGYPKGQLRWFSGNDDWTKSAKMEVKKMDNGLFSLTSSLSLLPGSTLPEYTCVVYNASGNKEDEATFEMKSPGAVMGSEKEGSSPSKIVAPVVTIGSLIVGLLLILVLRKRCSRRDQHMDYIREDDFERGELQNMRTDADTPIKS